MNEMVNFRIILGEIEASDDISKFEGFLNKIMALEDKELNKKFCKKFRLLFQKSKDPVVLKKAVEIINEDDFLFITTPGQYTKIYENLLNQVQLVINETDKTVLQGFSFNQLVKSLGEAAITKLYLDKIT